MPDTINFFILNEGLISLLNDELLEKFGDGKFEVGIGAEIIKNLLNEFGSNAIERIINCIPII